MANRNLQRRSILDPAVADLLTGMENKQAEARLPRRVRQDAQLRDRWRQYLHVVGRLGPGARVAADAWQRAGRPQ